MTESFPASITPNEQQTAAFRIETMRAYDPAMAADIGLLMHELDADFSAVAVPREKLMPIINDPERAQLVALSPNGQVVGSATMNTLLAVGKPAEGWLEDFVVAESARGSGVAAKLYQAMADWSVERGLRQFSFGTETDREAAVAFYDRQGAALDPHIKHLTYALPPETPKIPESGLVIAENDLGTQERRHIAVVDPATATYAGWLTMNTLRGAGKQPEGWFDNLTIDPAWAGHDVEPLLWQAAANWTRQQGLAQFSFALDQRHQAMDFCRQQGAVQDDTALHYTQRITT